nr:hypothetical protein [Desulfobulbaceae bacterium]
MQEIAQANFRKEFGYYANRTIATGGDHIKKRDGRLRTNDGRDAMEIENELVNKKNK